VTKDKARPSRAELQTTTEMLAVRGRSSRLWVREDDFRGHNLDACQVAACF
jgi:hypothetical protein